MRLPGCDAVYAIQSFPVFLEFDIRDHKQMALHCVVFVLEVAFVQLFRFRMPLDLAE